jgi:DNA-3-methyladenine glycosylase
VKRADRGLGMGGVREPRHAAFYARSVHQVARDLLGCTIRHAGAAGRIVEVESYHQEEPACHAFVGLTPRTRTLFGPPAHAYVYRSYGIHALLNFVAEEDGVGAAVLIRALEPLDGLEPMRRRRGVRQARELCSGPGKLTQALAIGLDLNGAPLVGGPIEVEPRPADARPPAVTTGERIGITKATGLPWRFCDATSGCVSRPWPAMMRPGAAAAPRRAA